jgi:hypothetical protein
LAWLFHDIVLDDAAFKTASEEMAALKTRTEELKIKLEGMCTELTTALNTPAGKAVELVAKEVLIKPIEDLLLIIQHISETLTEIIDIDHYKDVFIKFEELNESVKFN